MATVLVTGANRGVGLALVKEYLARGDDVIATTRRPDASSALMGLARGSPRLTVLTADMIDEAALATAAKALGSRSIDILICNAGVMSDRGGIDDPGHGAAEWQRVMMANVAGAFLPTRAFLPHLRRAKGARIAYVSSQMGSSQLTAGRTLAYRASKAAMNNLGLNLAAELKAEGIALGLYHPGWVSTDIGGQSAPVTPTASAKGLVERIDKLTIASTGIFEDYLGKPFAF